MEEPSATTEVSPSRDACAEKNSVHDCSFGSSKEQSLSMPLCFLVKEQAKSYIAIQELQKRLNQVESVQDDVIDAIIEFRNYLCDTRSFASVNHITTSSLNSTRSPATIFSKFTVQKSNENNVPSATESTVEAPTSSILKIKPFSSKECDHVFNEFGRLPTNLNSQDHSQKTFDLIKSKDSVLESDKQDSGLDSDCREHNDIHPSINKNIPNVLCHESNDELLQLLDEINNRSAILQKQLAVAEDLSPETDLKATSASSRPDKNARGNEYLESKFGLLGISNTGFSQSRDHFSKSNAATVEIRELYEEQNIPNTFRHGSNGIGLFEKPVSTKISMRKRAINSIDSVTVSSILKENNAVDLQRQALIYLVDNAVLHTKLKEAEQKLSSKHLEGERVENSLKEEARLLMMENRELRLSLDEQKMESHNMKSRLLMLERALQSVTHENQELTWQLGESLNLQTLSKKRLHNYSSSFSCENQVGSSKVGRRASMPPRLPCQNDANVSCVKSKLLSNTSSFLDITMEDADDGVPPQVPSNSAALKCRNGPLHSSTPMPSSQKQKAFRLSMNTSQETSPVNFHSVKKCLQSSYDTSSKNQKSDRYLEETHCKTLNIPRNISEETLPLENTSNFPFNTILEKLKSNSEYRLSKSASAKHGTMSGCNLDSPASASSSQVKVTALKENENFSHPKENKSLQGNSSDVVLQRKKGRNIQQRIQNILDRIVAESEEAS